MVADPTRHHRRVATDIGRGGELSDVHARLGAHAGRVASNVAMSLSWRMVRPMSSRPLTKRCCVKSSIGNSPESPAFGASIVRRSMSMVISSVGSALRTGLFQRPIRGRLRMRFGRMGSRRRFRLRMSALHVGNDRHP